jgi:hypothetical protein
VQIRLHGSMALILASNVLIDLAEFLVAKKVYHESATERSCVFQVPNSFLPVPSVLIPWLQPKC